MEWRYPRRRCRDNATPTDGSLGFRCRRTIDNAHEWETTMNEEQLPMGIQSKISNGTAVVGVIGLGYVGLPLIAAFHAAGFPVLGFDVDPKKISALKRGD